MLISGLHIGWGIWRLFFEEPWMPEQSRPLFILTKMSWYVTAIIGKHNNHCSCFDLLPYKSILSFHKKRVMYFNVSRRICWISFGFNIAEKCNIRKLLL